MKKQFSEIRLFNGREKSLLRAHPWVFNSAVEYKGPEIAPGAIVRLCAHDGTFLAYVGYSPQSQIIGRVWSFVEAEPPTKKLLENRITQALTMRETVLPQITKNPAGAYRVVHGESDFMPGVVIDRYADTAVLQISAMAAEPWRDDIADLLMTLPGITRVFERSDADVRTLEGLDARVGLLRGSALPEAGVLIDEAGMRTLVDVATGHKTGFYLDQRDNRALTRALATERTVLNCFCYTGTMSIAALQGGASHVTSIDSAAPALAKLQENLALNDIDAGRSTAMDADVFEALRKFRDRAQSFDLIILDPPKFAPTASHAEKAARAYKDINLLGFKLLRPGGLLMTYSCSGGINADLFQKIVAGAAQDAKVNAQILQRLGAGIDHPVAINFPEGDYLKGLLLRRAI
jgi:23S rRNA (cytosine1962-C5)-methyltransferase